MRGARREAPPGHRLSGSAGLGSAPERRRGLSAILLAAGFGMFGPLPAFFLGALAVLIREDLRFSEAKLGATVAVFFAFAAIGAASAGRLADRRGARPALRIGLSATLLALAAMAFATSWWQLPAALAVAGIGHAILQVASNLLLARDVAPQIQGIAFGIKQSAIPAATLAAGASVPILGTQLGWRWTYGIAAIVAALVLALNGRRRGPAYRRSFHRPPVPPAHAKAFTRPELLALSVGVGLAAAAANTLASFLVAYAVHSGMGVGPAGLLLAVASALGLLTRIIIGWAADSRGATDLGWVATMLAVGGLSFALLPVATGDSLLIWAAAALAFAGGWGWPGLFTFIVARRNAHEAGSATGLTQVGVFVGAVIGPLTFGLTVSAFSYATAWRGAAVAQVLGALLLLVIRGARRRRFRGAGLE